MDTVTLRLHEPVEDGVYRAIHSWEPVESGHGKDIYYLFLHARVQWRTPPCEEDIFTIVMQYSPTPGGRVALRQPAHILASEAPAVLKAFATFIDRSRKGA